ANGDARNERHACDQSRRHPSRLARRVTTCGAGLLRFLETRGRFCNSFPASFAGSAILRPMRQRAVAVGFLAAAAVAALSAQSAPRPTQLQAGDIVITGGQLFDSVRDTAVPNTGIVVRNGVLLEVGATLDGRDLSQAQVVRLGADEYVLPGL